MNLAAHFRSDGSARAGNQDTATGDSAGNRILVQVGWRSTEEIVELQIAYVASWPRAAHHLRDRWNNQRSDTQQRSFRRHIPDQFRIWVGHRDHHRVRAETRSDRSQIASCPAHVDSGNVQVALARVVIEQGDGFIRHPFVQLHLPRQVLANAAGTQDDYLPPVRILSPMPVRQCATEPSNSQYAPQCECSREHRHAPRHRVRLDQTDGRQQQRGRDRSDRRQRHAFLEARKDVPASVDSHRTADGAVHHRGSRGNEYRRADLHMFRFEVESRPGRHLSLP